MVTARANAAIRTKPMAIHVNAYEPASGFESRWGYHMRRESALERSPHSVVGLEKYVIAERPLRCRPDARRGNVRTKFSVVHQVLDRNAA